MAQFRSRPRISATVAPETLSALEARAEQAREPVSQLVDRILRAGLGLGDAQVLNPRDPAPRTA